MLAAEAPVRLDAASAQRMYPIAHSIINSTHLAQDMIGYATSAPPHSQYFLETLSDTKGYASA